MSKSAVRPTAASATTRRPSRSCAGSSRRAGGKPKAGVRRLLSLILLGLLPSATSLDAQRLSPDSIRALVDGHRLEAIGLYRDLLSLPNVASFPDDILRLLDWIEPAFQERGFNTVRLETGGSPVLLAERSVSNPTRTVLVYLQADGQPVDPAAWNQADPFDPVLKERSEDRWSEIPWERVEGEIDPDWRVFARSASDSKGPIAQFLNAVTLLDRAGVEPDFDLKVIVDTEEEIGSPNLPATLIRNSDRLSGDMLVIFDGPPHVSNEPTLKFGARGIATVTLTVFGPRAPQHSGHYGNYIPNPAIRLAQLIATMKDDEGRVTIPGWYDGIVLDDETRAILAEVPDDEVAIRRQMGIAEIDAVATGLQEAVQYPSLNVRGISAGWVGDEVRTIIPATAVAEIDVRLVRETDGERMIGLLRDHIESQGYLLLDREPTEDERMSESRIARFRSSISYGAFRTDFDSEPGVWLNGAMEHLFGSSPIRIRTSGGSIPISPFVETLGVPAVSVPTVNGDNNQHSPNENLRMGNFLEGIAIILSVLQQPLGPVL